jgi:hypothetical protein
MQLYMVCDLHSRKFIAWNEEPGKSIEKGGTNDH